MFVKSSCCLFQQTQIYYNSCMQSLINLFAGFKSYLKEVVIENCRLPISTILLWLNDSISVRMTAIGLDHYIPTSKVILIKLLLLWPTLLEIAYTCTYTHNSLQYYVTYSIFAELPDRSTPGSRLSGCPASSSQTNGSWQPKNHTLAIYVIVKIIQVMWKSTFCITVVVLFQIQTCHPWRSPLDMGFSIRVARGDIQIKPIRINF